MLVLSRRVEDKILIPDLGITIEVVSIKGNTVRLGIDAPREIKIKRGELSDRDESQLDVAAPSLSACVQESRSLYQFARNRSARRIETVEPKTAV